MKRGFSLIELILAIGLFTGIMVVVMFVVLSAGGRIRADVDEARLVSEMGYAMKNIRLYCAGASEIRNGFNPDEDSSLTSLTFRRESDVNIVTPGDTDDDIWRLYHKNDNKDIVLRTGNTNDADSGTEEVLVESTFAPEISFTHEVASESNFFTVTITGEVGPYGRKKKLSKTSGIRLWYAEAVL